MGQRVSGLPRRGQGSGRRLETTQSGVKVDRPLVDGDILAAVRTCQTTLSASRRGARLQAGNDFGR